MFRWRDREPGKGLSWGVDWGFTDRRGGVSIGRYAAFNLGAHVGDDPQAVRTNRERLAEQFELEPSDLRFMRQVHGTAAHLVGPSGDPSSDPDAEAPGVDTLITDSPDVGIVVLAADCTPVLLVDRREGLAAAVHAGRQGMVAGVIPQAVIRLRALGAADLEALVGPAICARCYEVPEEMRQEAAAVSPGSWAQSWDGTPAIDVTAGVVAQLAEAGVATTRLPGCSREDPMLFSHRRDGVTGRQAAVVRLLPPEGVA